MKTQLLIHVEGGLVTDVQSNGGDIEYTVIDHDAEGSLEDEILIFKNHRHPEENGEIICPRAISQPVTADPKYVAHTLLQIRHHWEEQNEPNVLGCPSCGHEWPHSEGP